MESFRDLAKRDLAMVIGHRGAPHAARENTIEAFEAAITEAADAIEFDVRRTRDRTLIVHHDANIAGASMSLANQTYQSASEEASLAGYHIPTVKETLECCAGRIALDIELKECGYEQDVYNIVREYYETDNVLFKSFNDSSVQTLKSIDSGTIVGLLLGEPPPVSIWTRISELFPSKRLRGCQADFVSPHWKLLRFGFVTRMRAMTMPVLVWTVDNIDLVHKLASAGVKGIITNEPGKVRKAIMVSKSRTQWAVLD